MVEPGSCVPIGRARCRLRRPSPVVERGSCIPIGPARRVSVRDTRRQ
ncbi:hypothetical protein Cus16_0157 [Curtobacterium sp. ER1/6]|nr:hypothetical protein Cus16_0157 [Curtobacterium sp. ER1/6]